MDKNATSSKRFFVVTSVFFAAWWLFLLASALFPGQMSGVTAAAIFPGLLLLAMLFYITVEKVRDIEAPKVKNFPWMTSFSLLVYFVARYVILETPESAGDYLLYIALLPAVGFDCCISTLRRIDAM